MRIGSLAGSNPRLGDKHTFLPMPTASNRREASVG
jgi:hypothetical protein